MLPDFVLKKYLNLLVKKHVFPMKFKYDLRKINNMRFSPYKAFSIIYGQLSVEFKLFFGIKIGQLKETLILSKLIVF